jgi:hypothetical protein
MGLKGRMAKFNQLLGIWKEPGNRVIFSGVRGNYSIGEG